MGALTHQVLTQELTGNRKKPSNDSIKHIIIKHAVCLC
jgi:hypothetical protein